MASIRKIAKSATDSEDAAALKYVIPCSILYIEEPVVPVAVDDT